MPLKNTPTTNALLIFISVIFLIQCASQLLEGHDIPLAIGASSGYLVVSEGEWYRCISSLFLHGSIAHVLMNGMALLFAGRLVELRLGAPLFLISFFLCGLSSSIFSVFFNDPKVLSVGASGAIVGLIAIALILLPKGSQKIALQKDVVIFLIFSVVMTFFHFMNLDNWAHLGGAVGGTILGWMLRLTHFRSRIR